MMEVDNGTRRKRFFGFVGVYAGLMWGLVQVVDFMATRFGWDPGIVNLITIVSFGSIPAASVISFLNLSSARSTMVARLAVISVNVLLIVGVIVWIRPFSAKAKDGVSTLVKSSPSLQAMTWYNKGKFWFNPYDLADLDTAIQCFTKATQEDPTFALAYSQLSRAYYFKNSYLDPESHNAEKAFMFASNALALDSNLAEAHLAYAASLLTIENKYPYEQAYYGIMKALRLNPKMAEAYFYLSDIYTHLGFSEQARAALTKCGEFNPADFSFKADRFADAWVLGDSQNFSFALEEFKKVPTRNANPFFISFQILMLDYEGRRDEAENCLEMNLAKFPNEPNLLGAKAILLAKRKDTVGALKAIAQIENDAKNPKIGNVKFTHHVIYNIGAALAQIGKKREAIEKLQWAVDNGFPSYTMFKRDVLLNPLRSEPAFIALFNRLEKEYNRFQKIIEENTK